MSDRELELDGTADTHPCQCCGAISRTVWGWVNNPTGTEAGYLVEWTVGAVAERGAYFDLIIGKWGEGAEAKDRVAVSLECRYAADGPRFRFVDASNRPASKSELVSRALRRKDVIGTLIADTAFALVEHICLKDLRIREITAHHVLVHI